MAVPKVLVGSPVTSLKEYSINNYVSCLKSMTYPNKELLVLDNGPKEKNLSKIFASHGIPYHKTEHTNSVREMLVRDRNFFRKKTLDEGFDFWLSIEQDIACPSNAVESLLENKKEIVSAAYFNFSHEKQEFVPKPAMFSLVAPTEKELGIARRLFFDELWPSRLSEIFVAGLGCMLISRNVLEKLEFRFDQKVSVYDDVWFCKDAQKHGFKVFLDSSIVCQHDARFHSQELINKLGFS